MTAPPSCTGFLSLPVSARMPGTDSRQHQPQGLHGHRRSQGDRQRHHGPHATTAPNRAVAPSLPEGHLPPPDHLLAACKCLTQSHLPSRYQGHRPATDRRLCMAHNGCQLDHRSTPIVQFCAGSRREGTLRAGHLRIDPRCADRSSVLAVGCLTSLSADGDSGPAAWHGSICVEARSGGQSGAIVIMTVVSAWPRPQNGPSTTACCYLARNGMQVLVSLRHAGAKFRSVSVVRRLRVDSRAAAGERR